MGLWEARLEEQRAVEEVTCLHRAHWDHLPAQCGAQLRHVQLEAERRHARFLHLAAELLGHVSVMYAVVLNTRANSLQQITK